MIVDVLGALALLVAHMADQVEGVLLVAERGL
jgi:hypothetical protein